MLDFETPTYLTAKESQLMQSEVRFKAVPREYKALKSIFYS